MLIALAITASLMAATLVALDASFRAYQMTTEEASTHTIGRLAMHRMLAMIRTGQEFGPFPVDPTTTIVESDFVEFILEDGTPDGQFVELRWDETAEALYVTIDSGTPQLLLEGVLAQEDDDGNEIPMFTLEYEFGRNLYRATIDMLIQPDDNQGTDIDGQFANAPIHIVASAMPRVAAYE
jgi:hypothetical protein